MKNKKISVLVIMLFAATILLTGCGSKNKIETALNDAMDKTISLWKEKGNVTTVTMSGIQDGLSQQNKSYVIIASGDAEFEKSAVSKIYTIDVEEYKGNAFGLIRAMSKEAKVNYVMIYDAEENKYYNIEIEYKTVSINGEEKEYPYFKNATEIE